MIGGEPLRVPGRGVNRSSSVPQRQHPHPVPAFIRNDQGTASDDFPVAAKEIDHPGPNAIREHIETTNLNHAWSTAS